MRAFDRDRPASIAVGIALHQLAGGPGIGALPESTRLFEVVQLLSPIGV